MAKRKRTRNRKTEDASTDKPSSDSSVSKSGKKSSESGSRPPKRPAKSGRRPSRRRNSDDEILEHHWEVVSEDSSAGRRSDGRRGNGRRRDGSGQDREKSAGDEQAKQSQKTKQEEKSKQPKKAKRVQKTKRADQQTSRPSAADEVSEGKRPAKKRKRAKRMRKSAEATPEATPEATSKDISKEQELAAKPRELSQEKKKRPARKRRKRRPAEASRDAVAAEPVVEEKKSDELEETRPPRKRRERRPAKAPREAVATEPVVEEKKSDELEETRPPRKRRKRRPAEASRDAVAAEPVVEEKKSDELEETRPPRKRRERRPAKAPREAVAAEPLVNEPVVEPEPSREEEKSRHKAKQPAAEEGGFWDMELSDETQASLRAADYLEPTPVQAGLIPKAITGIDLMGQARTGTGKTAAFAIPILEQIETGVKKRGPQALVLVPTRELAVQVRDECDKLAMNSRARVVAVYGGKPIRQQMEKLKRGAEVVVGTPGRVMDHMARGTLFLGDLRIAVLDEADRMLDIGFRPDIEKILRKCPQSRQTLLLSATLPPPVTRLARQYMHEPEVLDFSPTDVAVETIEQFYFTVDAVKKFDLLVKLLKREDPAQAIIFCRTRRGTEKIYQRLSRKEKGAACIHGDLPQSTRDRVMREFRDGKVRLLMATDVVGRGIDVTRISHIINYDTPEFCDDYVHRVGRTGRMGREGVAYSFVTPEEGNELTRIEMRINRLLKRDEIEGFSSGPKPEGVEGEEEPEKPDAKPVFGRRGKRIRRAL